jgi:hypothetical protein
VTNESEHVIRCKRCFGRDVRPSRKGTFLDSIMGKLRRVPFRCRSCACRFYVYVPRETDQFEGVIESDTEPDQDVAKPAGQ